MNITQEAREQVAKLAEELNRVTEHRGVTFEPDAAVLVEAITAAEARSFERAREMAAGTAEQYPSNEYADIKVIRGCAAAIRAMEDQ